MPQNPHPQRRDFLKTAAAGAAGAIGIGALRFDKLNAQSTGGWVNGMQINPAIDNKRVICCHDPKMLTAVPTNKDFTNTNNAVDAAVVAANLDEMAMQLAQKTTATEAWSTIFRSSKDWGSTRVAMKTNGIGGSTTNRPKWAIYKKLCDVLISLGVKPANIVLYDACDDASVYYNAYISTTDTTKIRSAPTSVRAAGMGGFKAVTLINATAISAAADLVDGNIDILVNVAACKSHNGSGGHYNYGSCTLCMKNHLGTFTSGTQAQHSGNLHVANFTASPPPSPLALFEINQHSAILGGSPVRQQLCIVDALLSNGASGPGGSWDNRTDRLVMGTLAPVVDYFATKKILLDKTVMATSPMPTLGVTNAAIILPLFLSSFGYSESDAFQWVEYTPDSPPPIGGNSGSTGGTSGSGGAGSGGTSATGGTRSGGTSAAGGAGSGGTSAAGGARSGGTSAVGGAGSGGTSAVGGAGSGGTSAAGGAGSGGTSAAGGADSGGTASGGAGGTGGAATSAASASGGSATTGGTSAAAGTGGSRGNTGTTSAASNSGSGCDVVALDRRATRWGAVLAFGAVVAEKLRRLVSSGDRSS